MAQNIYDYHITDAFDPAKKSQNKHTTTQLFHKLISHNFQITKILSQHENDNNLITNFDKIKFCFEHIQKIHPKSDYSKIYQLIKNYDKKYYDTKMEKFQLDVMGIFDQNKLPNIADFIKKFIDSFKRDLALEVCLVYHRLRHFPQAKIKLYRAFPCHSYFKLLALVQKYYLVNKKNCNDIGVNDICEIFGNNDFINNDEIITIIIDAVSNRNKLFVYAYMLYIETITKNIKPKYKTKHNYFPFNVFSSALFAMDHMLSF